MTGSLSDAQVFAIERPHPQLFKLYVIRAILTGPGFVVLMPLLYFRYETMRFRFDAEGVHMRWGILGEFNRSLQQLSKEKLQWLLRDDVGLIARGEAPSVLQVVRRRDAVNIDNGSGRRSRAGCRVGMPQARPGSRNRSARAGSARMAACGRPI